MSGRSPTAVYIRSRRRQAYATPRWLPSDGTYLAARLVAQARGDLDEARAELMAANWGPAPITSAARRTADRLIDELDGDVARALVLLSRAA